MTPIVWPIRSWDPYNKIGKYALQDVYEWRDRGLLEATAILGKTSDEDMIVVAEV